MQQKERISPNPDSFPPADIDVKFHFSPDRGKDSHCRLRIYDRQPWSVVVFSEMIDNRGVSITNAANHLVSLVVTQFELDRKATLFLEHHPNDYHQANNQWKTHEESLDLLLFEWTGDTPGTVHWSPVAHRLPGGKVSRGRSLDEPNSPIAFLAEAWRGDRSLKE